jgi:hypothetical protein
LSSVSTQVSDDKKRSVDFLLEQVKLMTISHKNCLRYSCETLLLCSLLHSISPHAYKFLRNSNTLILPSTKTLKNICSNFAIDPNSEQNDARFLQFAASKFKYLQENDKLLVLMLDEIHLKPYLDYKGGNIVGSAFNSTNLPTSAHVFMVNSLKSTYKEVVHILPMKKLNAECLHAVMKKVILGLEEIGFEICIVATDNNSINRKTITVCRPTRIFERV